MRILLTWWPTLAFTVALLLLTVAAFIRGGPVVRAASKTMLLEQVATLTLSRLPFDRLHIAMAAGDLVVLLGLIWISSHTSQRWPLMLAALQTLTVLGRLARLLHPKVWPLAAAIMVSWPAWPCVLVLAWGMVVDRRPVSSTSRNY